LDRSFFGQLEKRLLDFDGSRPETTDKMLWGGRQDSSKIADYGH